MAKLQAEDGSFLFPFVGAGDATYFEWAEVHVRFSREPTEQERHAIARRVPPPLQDSIDWDGAQLMAASGQFAHMVIDESYPADPGDTDGSEEDEDEEPGRFFFAKRSQVRKFNEDTQEWLAEAHQHCPVLVAFRHEDLESGGTELSPWHDWSVKQVPDLLSHFEHSLTDGDRTHSAYMLRGILGMALEADPKMEIPQRFRDWLEPGKKELEATERGDMERLVELLGQQEKIRPAALEVLADQLDEESPKQLRTLFAAADLLLRQPSLPDRLTAALAAGAIHAMHDKQHAEGPEVEQVLARVSSLAHESSGVGDQIANLGYGMIQETRWTEAIALFELIYDAPGLEKTAYNNALYAIMADNNDLPVDVDRHRRFVEAALPHGPQNPSIFYNAACIYYELGELDQVFEQIRLALGNGYHAPKQIKDEPLFAPIAKDPRFTELFKAPRKKGAKKKTTKKTTKKKTTKEKPAKKKTTKKKTTKKKPAKKKTTKKKPAKD